MYQDKLLINFVVHAISANLKQQVGLLKVSRFLVGWFVLAAGLVRAHLDFCWNREFRVFLRKIVTFSVHTVQLMQTMPKHIFWRIIDCSSLYAIGVTRGQGAVLRQIGGRGHFRSRDKDGGHIIRCAIAKNTLLHANCTALSFIELELLPIELRE